LRNQTVKDTKKEEPEKWKKNQQKGSPSEGKGDVLL
jgi:hypothetical protein